MWFLLSIALAADGGAGGAAYPQLSSSSLYRAGAGDVLSLEVFGEADMCRDLRVSEEGVISVPYAGQISVIGLTVDQIEHLIVERLGNSVLVAPQVVLRVRSYGQSVEVAGRVKVVGRYPISEAGMTVTQMLTAAGGPADVSAPIAYLSRGSDRLRIDLEAILNGDRSSDYPVEPGDVIVVPETPIVQIMGEVEDPGLVPYRPGLRLTDALAAAKGLTQTANRRVILLTRDGETLRVNYLRILRQQEEDPELKPYDKIEVMQSAF